ncbi:MAG: hypothetical protein QM831_14410 [Kofleriaceae bacterium]
MQQIRQHAGGRIRTEAGERDDRIAQLVGQALELFDQQVDDVRGQPAPANLVEIPVPLAVECQEIVVDERGREVDREERIAAGLVVNERGEPTGRLIEHVREHFGVCADRQRAELDLGDDRTRGADRFERARQRGMTGDFVVAIRADHDDIAHVAQREEVAQEIERREIRPLEVVDEYGQRATALRERDEQRGQRAMNAGLRFDNTARW